MGRSVLSQPQLKAKICLIGPGSVGKTSLIQRFVYDAFDDRYKVTLGAKVTKKDVVVKRPGRDDVLMAMMIWDIMGQREFGDPLKGAFFQGARRRFFDGTHGILAVCDVTRRNSLEGVQAWIETVQRATGELPIHLLANKIDLRERAAFTEEELQEAAAPYGAPHVYTSAKTGEGVEEAFQGLAGRLV